MPTVGEVAELAWGYTMADVETFTKVAVKVSYRTWGLDWSDRWETAWHAVVEHLYAATEHPTPFALKQAALDALSDLRSAHRHHHGITAKNEPMPSFAKYWHGPPSQTDFTDRIAERLALPRALSVLTALEYEAVSTLAVHGSNERAAAALGVDVKTFNARISRARRRFIAAWLSPETPPQPYDLTKFCKAGHPRTEEHGYPLAAGRWRCRTCHRKRDRKQKAAARSTDEGRARNAARSREFRARQAAS